MEFMGGEKIEVIGEAERDEADAVFRAAQEARDGADDREMMPPGPRLARLELLVGFEVAVFGELNFPDLAPG